MRTAKHKYTKHGADMNTSEREEGLHGRTEDDEEDRGCHREGGWELGENWELSSTKIRFPAAV